MRRVAPLVPRAVLGPVLGAVLAVGLGMGGSAFAHDNHKHTEPAAEPPAPPVAASPFPVQVDGRFALVDQDGVARTEQDYRGRFTLIFFGYATCKGICSVALPRMAAAMDQLDDLGDAVQPILITVDPVRDTPEALRQALPAIHERLVGLTGSDDALADAREAFGVESELVFVDPTIGEVFRHGAFLYLMGPDGTLLSVLPPILGSQRIAEIVRGHVASG